MLYALEIAATWGPALFYSAGAMVNCLSSDKKEKPQTFENKRFSNVINQVDEIKTNISFSRPPKECNGPIATNGKNFSAESLIFIDKKFEQIIEDTDFEFSLLHELAHIKNNDLLVNPLSAVVGTVVSTLALPLIKSMLPSWLQPVVYTIPLLVGTKIYWISARNCESRADNYACEKSTDKQLLAAERFFQVEVDLNKDINTHEYNSPFTKEGDAPSDKIHPSSSKRLNAIRKEMKKRGLKSPERNTKDEKHKMQQIRNYFISTYENSYNPKVVGTIKNIKKYK